MFWELFEVLDLNSEVRESEREGSTKLEEEKNTCWAFHACGTLPCFSFQEGATSLKRKVQEQEHLLTGKAHIKWGKRPNGFIKKRLKSTGASGHSEQLLRIFFLQWNNKRWSYWRMEQEHHRSMGSFSIQDSIQSLTSSLGSQSTLLSSCAGTVTDVTDLLFISFPCYCCHLYLFVFSQRVSFCNCGQSTFGLEFDTDRSWPFESISLLVSFLLINHHWSHKVGWWL